MSRDLTAAMETAITAGKFRRVRFYEGEFASGTTRLWTGVGTITWDGKSWLGVGHLGGVSNIEETTEIKATSVTVFLSGVPSANIALVLSEARQGKPGRIWEGARDEISGAILADPAKSFEGRLDVADIDEQGETSTVRITYASRLADLETARERRYTHQDQQIDFSGDLGFEFIGSLQDKVISWGRG